MTIKKKYALGDTVWIYGISKNNVPTKGTVVHSFNINYEGFDDETHYVIAVPTVIEHLIEVRTWHTISQDSKGPIGSLRDIADLDSANKIAARSGYQYRAHDSHEEPTDEQIHAALENSINSSRHNQWITKTVKTRSKRSTSRKRNKNV